MSISWGSEEGSNDEKVGIDITQSPSTVSSGTTSVTLTIKYYVYSQYSVNDNQTLNFTGAATGSSTNNLDPLNNVGSNVLVATKTVTVTPSFSGTISKTFTATISGHYGGATPSKTRTWTVDQRPYAVPAAVTGATASKISATTNRVSWTNHASTEGPYSSVYVDYSTDNFATYVGNQLGVVSSWDHANANPALSYKYRVKPHGAGGWASSYSTSGETIRIPPVPAGVSMTMILVDDPSGDGAKTSNTANLTLSHPYCVTQNMPQLWELQIWSNSSNAWTTYGSWSITPGEASPTVSVVGFPSDGQHVARVRYYNIAGYTTYVSSNTVYSTVATPTGPTVPTKANAVRSGLANIALSWLNPSVVANNTEVWWSTSSNGGSTWSAFSKIAMLTAATTTYTHTGPTAANQHKYKIINTTTSGLVSHPLVSDPVQLLTAPLAPVISGCPWAANTVAFDVTSTTSVALSWVHSPVDGTIQAGYELQVRHAGVAWPVTTKTVSSSNNVVWNLSTNGIKVEWRVRTWGQHADPSPWSATGTFRTSAKPVVTVSVPAAPSSGVWRLWPSPSITVSHSYSDAEGKAQAKHRTELWDEADTTLLWWSETSNADLTEEVKYTLKDGTGTKTDGLWSVPSRYIVKKKVMDADGLWSAVFSRKIEVVWDTPPATPDPPTSLTPEPSVDGTTATISWIAPASANDGVIGDSGKNPWGHVVLERWDNVTNVWSFIKNVSTRVSGSTTDTVELNHRYQYRLKAQSTMTSAVDETLILTATSPILTQSSTMNTTPTSPSSISATQPSDIVILSWTDNASYPVKIEIQRLNNDIDGDSYVTIEMVDGAQGQFPDLNINENTSYTYRCRAMSGSMTGEWSSTSVLRTKSISNTSLHSVTVPPVRRNGPRESEKENIEAAEIGAIAALVRQKTVTFNADIVQLSVDVGNNNEAMYSGIEAARLKTEIK